MILLIAIFFYNSKLTSSNPADKNIVEGTSLHTTVIINTIVKHFVSFILAPKNYLC